MSVRCAYRPVSARRVSVQSVAVRKPTTCRQIRPVAVCCGLCGWTSNPRVGGSNPPGRIEYRLETALIATNVGVPGQRG